MRLAFFHGLKINIAVHLVLLLTMAMILTNIVMIAAFEKILIYSFVEKGRILESFITYPAGIDEIADKGLLNLRKSINAVMRVEGFAAVLIFDKNSRLMLEQKTGFNNSLLEELVHRSINANERITRFSGKTWGTFLPRNEFLLMAMPLKKGNKILGGAGLVFDLKSTYKTLRHIQRLMWFYIIANVFFLAMLGFYQISKISVRPLLRLVKRAEEYKEDNENIFNFEQKNTEFNRLSYALNRMMMRISEDKERLKATVESLKEANAELKLAQKEIIKAEKMAAVGRLSAGIAHEIGNPISIVLGYLDLLKKEKVGEEERNDFIVRVEKEIKRIHLIIRGLLDFSRPANGPAQSFSAHEVLHELSDMVKLQPFMSKINLTFDLSAGNDIVLGNPNSLKQVFLNLLINAADSVSARHRPDGRISICTENIIINEEGLDGKKQILQIKVNDNGTGISENEVENIFDPFFTTKAPGKGTGLGLFVCFMLVQDMEGNIQAESRLNEGTTMIVKLPVCDINIKQNTEFRSQNPEGRK